MGREKGEITRGDWLRFKATGVSKVILNSATIIIIIIKCIC